MFELIINILLFIFLGFTFFTHVLEDDVLFAQQQTVEEEDEQRGHDEADGLQNEGGGDHDHDAQEQLALEEAGDAPHKSAQREIRIALVLLDDLDDVHDQADLKQNDDCLWPNVRLILFFYGLLIGEKNIVRLLIASVCITMVLYIVFSGMLSVNLNRIAVIEPPVMDEQ